MQNAGDDDHAAGAGVKHRVEILPLHAADAEDGDAHGIVDAADVCEADGGASGFRGCGKERAKADVVRAFPGGGESLRVAVRGLADDGRRNLAGEGAPCAPAGIGDGAVVLPDVCALRADGGDEFGEVIDDERDARRLADWREADGEGFDLLLGAAFRAELDDVHTARAHLLPHPLDGLGRDVAEIDDAVEVAGGEW